MWDLMHGKLFSLLYIWLGADSLAPALWVRIPPGASRNYPQISVISLNKNIVIIVKSD